MHAYKRIVNEDTVYYGRHLIVDASGCNGRHKDVSLVREFVVSLVAKIGMVRWGPCICERFGEGREVGISCVQLIETSSITVHTNDEFGDLYLDVFSCKDFDPAIVVGLIHETFSPQSIEQRDIFRR
jgi:S-adenosylmethionine/arginine decarboxylase-like enzyme